MENVNLEDLDNESLIELMTILEGMDDVLKGEEEVEEDEQY